MKRVLIIGGYGNFGSFIASSLAREPNIQIIIAGRSLAKANDLKERLDWKTEPETARLDVTTKISNVLTELRPDIVIHTSGPFQSQGYQVAKDCINFGCHYIDLADGRDFVSGVTKMNSDATNANVLVTSGASSLPCLSSALVDHYALSFAEMLELEYGITTAQKSSRGLATVAAILSYTGKPFNTLHNGRWIEVFGWQSMHMHSYAELGHRLLSNCDVPDLSLFPSRYPKLKSIKFFAGLELPFIHVSLWLLSWLVRFKVVWNLQKLAPLLLKASYLFDRWGTENSGFHMNISGIGHDGVDKTIKFELTALSGDGPLIPTIPAVLITKKLASGELKKVGAFPCMGLLSKDEYLSALAHFDIAWKEEVVVDLSQIGRVNYDL